MSRSPGPTRRALRLSRITPEKGNGKTIPLIDLAGEYLLLKKKIDAALRRILSSGAYILGQETRRLEEEIAAYCQVKHAVGVNSGTDAIRLALRALDIGSGDEVIVPAMSFMATAEPIAQLGARPIFVDIDPQTYNMNSRQVEGKISSRTKAMIAVHLYGQPADLDPLMELARKYNVPLIEDVAQALGSEYHGKKAGSLGRMACLSFYPTENLGAYGDGGMVLTSDEALDFRLRRLRNHGARVKYDHEELGYNSRLDEIQAALLRVKLNYLDTWNHKRITLAKEYNRRLNGLPLRVPFAASDRTHIYHLYSICTPPRDALRAYLKEHRIDSGMYYPKPLHLQTAFKYLGGKPGDFPHSERLAKETLSLPLFPQLLKNDVHRVVHVLEDFFRKHTT